MSSNIFVCFIGIDGSGKTTLANKVFETYKEISKLKFTYGRFIPILTKVLMYIGKRFFLKNNPVLKIDVAIKRSYIYPFLEKILITFLSFFPENLKIIIYRVLDIR